MGFGIQGGADFYFVSRKLLRLVLVFEAVNLRLYDQHKHSSHLLGTMQSAASCIASEYPFFRHGFMGTACGMDVIGTLAVHNLALQSKHAWVFVLGNSRGGHHQRDQD